MQSFTLNKICICGIIGLLIMQHWYTSLLFTVIIDMSIAVFLQILDTNTFFRTLTKDGIKFDKLCDELKVTRHYIQIQWNYLK